jgi:type IV pilus assembly protein PilV
MKAPNSQRVTAGFSLVEVMVALVVVSIGLLGIAKMQALALSSTGSAKMRSLASIEAASLASTIHADRAYWAYITTATTVTVGSTGTVASAADATLNSSAGAGRPALCTKIVPAVPCTAAQIAAGDLGDWADSLVALLPRNGKSGATITCSPFVINTSNNCVIKISWTDNVVTTSADTVQGATAQTTQNALTNFAQNTYQLYVNP